MRLLSFLTQVEATLAMLRPGDALGWRRRVDPLAGSATAWHPRLGLSLHLRVSAVGEDRHGLHARWSGPAGEVLGERTYFCGPSGFDWQRAAESVAELAPAEVPADEANLPVPERASA
jgi:hypothetical protein